VSGRERVPACGGWLPWFRWKAFRDSGSEPDP
jgi:hypothetical protein